MGEVLELLVEIIIGKAKWAINLFLAGIVIIALFFVYSWYTTTSGNDIVEAQNNQQTIKCTKMFKDIILKPGQYKLEDSLVSFYVFGIATTAEPKNCKIIK